MKGVIFTELLDMVSQEIGQSDVEEVLNSLELQSKGAYTAVGQYNYGEFFPILREFSDRLSITFEEMLNRFSSHLFSYFSKTYPRFFEGVDLFQFLQNIEDYIHPEVRKLYPDAELPSFSSKLDGDFLRLKYRSSRGLGLFAQGLILAAIEHFNEPVALEVKTDDNDQNNVEFQLIKTQA